jgi:hypothetical protein
MLERPISFDNPKETPPSETGTGKMFEDMK